MMSQKNKGSTQPLFIYRFEKTFCDSFWICVGVCGCVIPRWNRLGTHMNARPPDKRPRAPHARNQQNCVFYYIRHDFSAVFRARTHVWGCTIPQWNHMNASPPLKCPHTPLACPRAPHARKWLKCVFYYISQLQMAILRLEQKRRVVGWAKQMTLSNSLAPHACSSRWRYFTT